VSQKTQNFSFALSDENTCTRDAVCVRDVRTTYLGVPCLTLRSNTERPVTVRVGTNVLVGQDIMKLSSELTKILEGRAKTGSIPPLWDSQSGERIAEIFCGF
jgi:UDP-N-acetylglucosamine 2-epimerase